MIGTPRPVDVCSLTRVVGGTLEERQELQRPDIELLGRVLDILQIDLHFTWILRACTTVFQSSLSAFIARPISSGVLPTGASPCAKNFSFITGSWSALLVSW